MSDVMAPGDLINLVKSMPGFGQLDRYRQWSKMTPDQILATGKIKNPTLLTLYNDLYNAQKGPALYSENDIRNAGLAFQSSAAPQWEAQKQGMAAGAAGAGMLDSGFYQKSLGQAEAAKNASVSAQALQASNQMRDANNTFQFNRMSTAANLLGAWLSNARKQRLNAIQMANLPGASGY